MENMENENMANTENGETCSEVSETSSACEQNGKKSYDWKKETMDWVQAIVIALVVSFLLKSFVLTLAEVKGESMEPTLQNEDRLYVNRFMYKPEKGDIIIFKPVTNPKKPYIKRVIATEGDTVYIDFETSEVYVNDELIDEPYINEDTELIGSYIKSLMTQGEYSRENPIVVERDKLFVMGDNRNHSTDSREIGQVPVKDVIGHAIFRFWPLGSVGGLGGTAE